MANATKIYGSTADVEFRNPFSMLMAVPTRTEIVVQQKILVQITQDDIASWGQEHCPHPLTEALRRSTKTSWRLVEPVMVVEKAAPYRTLVLCSDLMLQLLDCKHGAVALPYECEVELLLPFRD